MPGVIDEPQQPYLGVEGAEDPAWNHGHQTRFEERKQWGERNGNLDIALLKKDFQFAFELADTLKRSQLTAMRVALQCAVQGQCQGQTQQGIELQ